MGRIGIGDSDGCADRAFVIKPVSFPLVRARALTREGWLELTDAVVRGRGWPELFDPGRLDGEIVITPGLVDLHTHVLLGQDLGLDGARYSLSDGVTTLVDAGSAGADLVGLLISTLDDLDARWAAFLNISTLGTTGIRRRGELADPARIDEADAVAAAQAHPDRIIGIKVRASRNVGEEHTETAFRSARRAADLLQRPLMVHLGPPPMTFDDALEVMRAGDIVTHCYTSHENNCLLDSAGQVRTSALAARARGVLFDVGHGASGFNAEIATQAVRQGFPPDTISSDLHAYSIDQVRSLPRVINRMLECGMELSDALNAASRRPAAVLHAAGVATGSDLAVFRIECLGGSPRVVPIGGLLDGTLHSSNGTEVSL